MNEPEIENIRKSIQKLSGTIGRWLEVGKVEETSGDPTFQAVFKVAMNCVERLEAGTGHRAYVLDYVNRYDWYEQAKHRLKSGEWQLGGVFSTGPHTVLVVVVETKVMIYRIIEKHRQSLNYFRDKYHVTLHNKDNKDEQETNKL